MLVVGVFLPSLQRTHLQRIGEGNKLDLLLIASTYGAAKQKMATARFKVLEMALRACVVPLAVASLWEMATNKQADDTYGEISFSNLSGFKYLVFANAITAAYSVASILLSSIKSFARYDWLIFLLDQAAAYLLVTSCSAAAELVYLAREGDKEVSWGEVCSYFGRFCGRATVSVALQGAALLCFVVLSLGSAFRVFSKCDAPCRPGAAAGSKQPEGQFAY